MGAGHTYEFNGIDEDDSGATDEGTNGIEDNSNGIVDKAANRNQLHRIR